MSELPPIEIWRASNQMIEMFGEDAALKAALRADALLEQGDTEDFFAWKRITRAIDDLSREKREPSECLH
jgi:hypothetical protein